MLDLFPVSLLQIEDSSIDSLWLPSYLHINSGTSLRIGYGKDKIRKGGDMKTKMIICCKGETRVKYDCIL